MYIIEKFGTIDPVEILNRLGGYYQCPKDDQGRRLGPLVGYAARDEEGRQLVGDVYANFALAEEQPLIIKDLAFVLRWKLLNSFPAMTQFVFCGAPLGGITLAAMLGADSSCRFVYPEKKVIETATASSREKSQLVFNRHQVRKGDQVVIVEDVCNNFSTTGQLINLIEEGGGKRVVAIACLLNRSPAVDRSFSHMGRSVPVVALVRKILPEYWQDDPAVTEDLAAGNVVWKPKDEWSRLMTAMKTADH